MSFFIQNATSIGPIRALGVDVIAETIRQRYMFMTHKDVYRIVTGLARLDVLANTAVLSAIHLAVREHSRQFGAHELAGMAVDVAASHRRLERQFGTDLLISVVNEFRRKVHAASPPDLASVAVACADTGMTEPELFGKMAEAAILQIALFRGPELCDFMLSYVSLGLVHPQLMRLAVRALGDFSPTLPFPQLVDVGFMLMRLQGAIDKEESDPITHKWLRCIEERVTKDPGTLDGPRMASMAASVCELAGDLKSVPKTARMLQYKSHEWASFVDKDLLHGFAAKLGIQ